MPLPPLPRDPAHLASLSLEELRKGHAAAVWQFAMSGPDKAKDAHDVAEAYSEELLRRTEVRP
jgi:hypothetical protein